MKNTMKMLAMFTLSACVMTGGAVASFAAEPAASAAVLAHQSSTCGDDTNANAELIARFSNADGSTSLYTICAEGGEVNGTDTLTKLSNTSSNFSGLNVYTGTLDNGEQVMTVACISGGKAVSGVPANVWVPKSAVEGYDLYLVNSDGSQTKLNVTTSGATAFFEVNMPDGAALIRLIPQSNN